VARHHGMHASRANGSLLIYNQRDPWLPDLVICPRQQAAGLLDAIALAVVSVEMRKESAS
jgi:3'(2'), 5'-bisphosphate nucleotidase